MGGESGCFLNRREWVIQPEGPWAQLQYGCRMVAVCDTDKGVNLLQEQSSNM